MKITPHFELEEFAQPARHGFPAESYPEEWIRSRLRPLCECLEVIRETIGKPILITSGYRSKPYNVAIGGAKNSQHTHGKAADITAIGMSARDLWATILDLSEQGKIDRLRGLGKYPGFVHVDIRQSIRLVKWYGARVGN